MRQPIPDAVYGFDVPRRAWVVAEPAAQFTAISPRQATAFDLWSTGISPNVQPVAHMRGELARHNVVPAEKLAHMRHNTVCKVGGMVITRQRPGTAKGFVFLTLEDETGLVNVIVRPDVYERYRRTIRQSMTVIVEGQLQKESGCIDVIQPEADGGTMVAGCEAAVGRNEGYRRRIWRSNFGPHGWAVGSPSRQEPGRVVEMGLAAFESTVSAMCGSPPTKEPRKSTPSPAGDPPRNGTTVTPVAGSPGGQAMNVVPEWSATSGTRSKWIPVGLSGVESAGLRSAPSFS